MSRDGIKSLFDAGREKVRKLNADRERVDFIARLARQGEQAGIVLSPIENDFVWRVLNYNRNTPDLHPGDVNICDSLRERFERQLMNGGRRA